MVKTEDDADKAVPKRPRADEVRPNYIESLPKVVGTAGKIIALC